MCGIVAGISHTNIVNFLIDGLKQLEYRGYDSSGIAVISDNKIERIRRTGRVSEMEAANHILNLSSCCGIGHTRWATHGGVTEPNAHPHISHGDIAVVHNGIIENYETERAHLQQLGYVFESQTDTEVIAHSIHYFYEQLANAPDRPQDNTALLFEAVRLATARFQGAFAIAVIARALPEQLVIARMGCPLLVAFGQDEVFVASDVSAVIARTRHVMFLEEGDIAILNKTGIQKHIDRNGDVVERPIQISNLALAALELGHYTHFMQKEIHEQPKAISDTIEAIIEQAFAPTLFGDDAETVFNAIDSIKILACGTSYYAALTAKYWLEDIARIPCDVEIASEYRYRTVIANPKQLIITISQSGETLDTMEALKYAQSLGHAYSLSICNVLESALPRASTLVFYTRAGVEIGVASTKAFTTQLVALFSLAVTLGILRKTLSPADVNMHLDALRHLPASVQHVLNLEPQILVWAKHFATKSNALFLGRGIHYPIALEGALKLKEISYIHAEAYPAGELKHGPLALVDKNIPVLVIAPMDNLLNKIKANMQEVHARGGELFVFTDLDSELEGNTHQTNAGSTTNHSASALENDIANIHIIKTPRHVGILSPIVHVISVQLLAYHTAVLRGTDVDKPRNLAKSVTVE